MNIKSALLIGLLIGGVTLVACKQPIDERYYRKTRGVEYSGGWEEKGYRNTRSSRTTHETVMQSKTVSGQTSSYPVADTPAEPAENTDGPYNKSPIRQAPEIEQKVCPYGAIAGTCDCPAGLVAVDGVCTGVECRECYRDNKNCDCYFGENRCGRYCDSNGKNCREGACFAEEAKCDAIRVGHWEFEPNLRTNWGGCRNKAEKLGCRKQSNGSYTCYRDGQYCGKDCNADGTACQYGMCIPQTCNSIGGKRWTFSHIGYSDYGYGCMNPEGNLKCTKDGSAYRCFWPRKGNNWKDVLYTYPCSKSGKCGNNR